LLGGQLADPNIVSWFTYATPFWVAAGMTVIGMGIIFWYSQETLKKSNETRWKFFDTIWRGMRRPGLKSLFTANFFLALGYFTFFRFFPVFLERQFHFTSSQLSFVMVYDSLAIAAGVIWLIPFLSKRFKPIESLCLFAFLLSIAFIICLLPSSPYALFATLLAVGLCLAVVITYGALIISNASSEKFQGAAMGTLTSVQVLAEIFTGLGGGPLAAYAMTLPLYIGAAMAIICSVILFSSIRRQRIEG
jgi:DHA1 family tetracycline resistance protein-like MFS transporter